MFLLDANVLICCFHDYYPIDRIPEYWDWLAFQGEIGVVKIPPFIWDEAQEQENQLAQCPTRNEASIIGRVSSPPRKRGSRATAGSWSPWIPAFAGMTDKLLRFPYSFRVRL